jgi:glycosyltransferase involved in cell wall biosynthesis
MTTFAGVPGALVCLSSQAWDTPLWTNRQHVMSRLARRGPVVFVHTAYFLPRRLLQVLRAPGPGRMTRVVELLGGLRRREGAPMLFSAWNLLPMGTRFRAISRINARITAGRLRRALARRGLEVGVAWAYDPLTAPIVARLSPRLAVYHCVDDHAGQTESRLRRRSIARGEREMLASVDIVFTTAHSLAERLGHDHPHVYALGNVADYDHFSRALGAVVPADMAAIPEPRGVFVGALNEVKVDLALVGALSREMPELSVVLIGPETVTGESYRTALAGLSARPNVHLLGGRPYEELPGYLAGADVALVPYLENRYTAGVFPMKIYEYLAAGLPVVTAGLPETRGVGPGVRATTGVDQFIAATREALAAPGAASERQALAREHTWEARTAQMERFVRQLPERAR